MSSKLALSALTLAVILSACGVENSPQTSTPVPAQTTTTEPKAFDNSSLEGLTAGKFVLDRSHAHLAASVDHSGGLSDYFVTFTDYDAAITLDPAALENASVSVTINPARIFVNYPGDYKAGHADSGFETWTEDLTLNEKWLNAGNFPEITFVSTAVERTGHTTGKVTGDLTFLGVTRPVTMDVIFRGAIDNRWGEGKVLGFDAETTFNRSDFGLSTYIPAIGDEIELTFSAEFVSAPE